MNRGIRQLLSLLLIQSSRRHCILFQILLSIDDHIFKIVVHVVVMLSSYLTTHLWFTLEALLVGLFFVEKIAS